MSPIRQPPPFSGRTLVISVFAILAGVVVLFLASAALTARHNGRVGSVGLETGGIVQLGNASKLSAQIQRGGGVPLYFPDVSGNARRSVYLAHRGGRSTSGWTAFRAQVPGEAGSCQWQWNTKTQRFDASCDATRQADAQGKGLEQYPVTVVRGKLRLDLRGHAGAPTTVPTTTG